jgi:hypothetical protein
MSDPAVTLSRKPWTRDQALSLFKMYEDMGWGAKQQMVSIVTWLTTAIFGLIAFSVKSYCDPASASAATTLASLTALTLSIFMATMTWGTLKRADNIYKRADDVLKDAYTKHLLPPEIYKIMSPTTRASRLIEQRQRPKCVAGREEQKTEKSSPLRLGLRLIGTVYIIIVWATLIPALISFVLWLCPKKLAGTFWWNRQIVD